MTFSLENRVMITDAIACIFILLWTYAATTKLLDYGTFRVQIAQSPLLTPFAGVVAWLIPLVELFIAALLVFSSSRSAGLFLSFGLMMMFTAYIFVITRFSEHVPCSCGGILQKMSWQQHLLFNGVMDMLAVVALIVTPSKTDLLQQNRGIRKPVEKSRSNAYY